MVDFAPPRSLQPRGGVDRVLGATCREKVRKREIGGILCVFLHSVRLTVAVDVVKWRHGG